VRAGSSAWHERHKKGMPVQMPDLQDLIPGSQEAAGSNPARSTTERTRYIFKEKSSTLCTQG